MKRLLTILVALTCASAFARKHVEVETLAASPWADTEATTNCPFVLSDPNVRHLQLALDLAATSSNNVELAFGRDADSDGVLSLGEISLAVGWDAGSWFVREGLATGSSELAHWSAPAVTEESAKSFRFSLNLRVDRPRSVVASENGTPVVWNLPESLPEWMFSREWDTMRLAVRGADAPDEMVRARARVDGTALIVK